MLLQNPWLYALPPPSVLFQRLMSLAPCWWPTATFTPCRITRSWSCATTAACTASRWQSCRTSQQKSVVFVWGCHGVSINNTQQCLFRPRTSGLHRNGWQMTPTTVSLKSLRVKMRHRMETLKKTVKKWSNQHFNMIAAIYLAKRNIRKKGLLEAYEQVSDQTWKSFIIISCFFITFLFYLY